MTAILAETVTILFALTQTSYSGLFVAFAGLCITAGAWVGIAAAIALDILPREPRDTGTAAYFLITTILGPGLGPFVVAMASERMGSLAKAPALSTAIMGVAVFGLI